MEEKATSVIMLTLLLIGMLALAFNVQPVQASETIYIRPDGSVEGTDKIQLDGDLYTLTDDIYIDTNGIVIERNNMTLDGTGHTVQGSGVWFSRGVSLSERSNVTVRNLQIKGFTEGIGLYAATNNDIHRNDVANNRFGITLEHSSNDNDVYENYIANNGGWGINLYDSSNNNKICRNSLTDNEEDSISLDMSSSNNTVSGNNVASNRYGIRLWYSPNNSISENNVRGNEYGIYIRQSSDNVFYHNSFVDNLRQVRMYAPDPGETPPTNAWDDGYPSGGNYWSNYAGVDANSDGIGDSPYVIDERNQDRYPLMNPWRERTVGAKVGDWAKYIVDTSWMGFLDPRLEMLSETEWGMIEVTEVQGTVITFTGTSRLKNGSELTEAGAQWDVAPTGSFGFIFWFISSSLQAKDKVYPSGAVAINETVTRTYCGVPRENNHLNGSTSGSIVPGPPYDINKLDCYWDQVTGILTEELLEASTVDLSSTLSIHLKMVDTNLWETPISTTVNDLKTKIEELGSEGEIDNQGIVRSLIAKMNSAQKLIDKEKIGEAEMVLEGFITQVQELSEIHMTAGTADILIESAEYIISHL